ncbi:uncharacterized protein LOC131649934 [Vicia villosa]|uniref:uncharacterized protein LOC131649934 n=1 Tax=Vicia villosa TaxID=3911 RepID=UPI00273B69C4|nr:uncharacterized protein LOC131649934 [Vicia villosa]
MGRFQRNNPQIFKGRHGPDDAHRWLKGIENIFQVVIYSEEQKVQFVIYMLEEEVEEWWNNARQRMEILGTEITWTVFRASFMQKYFPEYVHRKKEIEFLELKQGNSTVVEYAARFEELVKYCLHYNNLAVEVSKCIKFESGLRLEIKQGVRYLKIRQFPILVNKCRIYDQDTRVKSSFYKSYNEKKGKNQDCGKPYSTPIDKGKHKVSKEKITNGG